MYAQKLSGLHLLHTSHHTTAKGRLMARFHKPSLPNWRFSVPHLSSPRISCLHTPTWPILSLPIEHPRQLPVNLHSACQINANPTRINSVAPAEYNHSTISHNQQATKSSSQATDLLILLPVLTLLWKAVAHGYMNHPNQRGSITSRSDQSLTVSMPTCPQNGFRSSRKSSIQDRRALPNARRSSRRARSAERRSTPRIMT